MEKRRVLITGASGFVGGHICLHLAKLGAEVIAVSGENNVSIEVENVVSNQVHVDLRCQKDVKKLLQKYLPDSIIHCAAISSGGLCQKFPELANTVNVEALRNILDVLLDSPRCKPFLIHFSTDLVFDGLSAPRGGFLEDIIPQSASVYGHSKLKAEKVIQNSDYRAAAICRLSLVYGRALSQKGGFMKWTLEGLEKQSKLNLFVDEWRTPIFVGDICRAVVALLHNPPHKTKIYHLSGSERIDRHSFGLKVADIFGYSNKNIIPASNKISINDAPRARDVSLNHRRTSKELEFSFLDVTSGLLKMREDF